MAKLYNLARMTTATTGTGTITLGSAVSSYLSFASAGVLNSDTVTYAIVDGSNREVGRGVYTSVGTTLTRATILESTNANAAINLSGSAEVFITAAAEDITSSVQITGGSITGITDLAVADGGTGASTLTGYVKGNGTLAMTAAATIPNTDITGLGTMSTQSASSVAITGGSITGITDLAIADGGTGASDAATARTNLGLGTIATQASSNVSITGGSITGITDLAVADGGTGVSSLTAYAVLAGGTTSTGAVQTVSGLGTSGQVLTSNGAGALPTWQASGGSALALEYISSGVQSGTTALAFTSIPSGYTTLYFHYNIQMSSNADFFVNLSSNNGTSYGVNRILNNGAANDGVGSGFASISNVGTTGTSKVITPRFSLITGIANSNTRAVGTYTTASTEATITGVINAIRFNHTATGNVATVVLYGVK